MLNLIQYSDLSKVKKISYSDIKNKIQSKKARQYLDFQDQETRNPSFFTMFACNSTPNQEVSESFKQGFMTMTLPQKKCFFQKNLNFTHQILTNQLELRDREAQYRNRQEQMVVSGKALINTEKMKSEWIQTQVIGNRYLKTLDIKVLRKRVDLHGYIVRFSQSDESIIVLQPIQPYLQKFKFKPLDRGMKEMKQKVALLMDDTQRQNMAILLGKGDIYSKQTKFDINQILLSMLSPEALISYANAKTLESHTDTQASSDGAKTDLLHFKHFWDPTPKEVPKRLIPNGPEHYFLKEDWKVGKDGILEGSNKQKIDMQSSAMKLIVKRLFFGGSISSISLPVQIYGNETTLYRLLQSFRNAPTILQDAVNIQNPVDRFKKVLAYAMTTPTIYNKMDKTFAPVLGQTCQLIVNGTVFLAEQICEDPPTMAIFIKGRGFTVWGHCQQKLELSFNVAHGTNAGWTNVSFDQNDINKKIVRFTAPQGEMHGTMVGSPTFNFIKHQYFVDEENMLFCRITHGHGEDKSRKDHKFLDCIQGHLVKISNKQLFKNPQKITKTDYSEVLGMFHGRWTEEVYFENELLINTRTEHPLDIESYPSLLQSDSTLRRVVILRKLGNFDEAQVQKQKTEAQQKHNTELRKKNATKSK